MSAYESTSVPISQSQEAIRRLIYGHRGTGVNFMSCPPREGFEAFVTIKEEPFHIRVMATCKAIVEHSKHGKRRSPSELQSMGEQEERRVWRVLYWHLKAMFEAADSGVIDIRDVILPYLVTRDGRTLSEHLVPRMGEISGLSGDRLLAATSQTP